jgi:hypothetical protein
LRGLPQVYFALGFCNIFRFNISGGAHDVRHSISFGPPRFTSDNLLLSTDDREEAAV